MGAVGQPHRSGGARDLLHGDHVLEVAEAKAAPVLLDGDPVQAELAHLGPELARELVGGVDLGGERGDAVGGETRGRLADGVGGLAEPEVHAGSVQGHAPA